MKLYDLAHSRTGDKGNISTISVIAYEPENFELIRTKVTTEAVRSKFAQLAVTKIERYELPQLGALNFVLHNALGGGVTRSLAIDTHGKSLSALMLDIEITSPEEDTIRS